MCDCIRLLLLGVIASNSSFLFCCFFLLRKLRTRDRTCVLSFCYYRQEIERDNRSFIIITRTLSSLVSWIKNIVLFLTLDGFFCRIELCNFSLIFPLIRLLYFFFLLLPRLAYIPFLCNITLYSYVYAELFFFGLVRPFFPHLMQSP